MPTGYEWWVSCNDYTYTGPYQTKDQAISHAILNGIFEELDNNEIGMYICEGQSPVVEDIIIDAEALLADLADCYEEYTNEDGVLFTGISETDVDDLQNMINHTFQTWARDHNLRPPRHNFVETRNDEYLKIPRPAHADKIKEDDNQT